MVVATEDEDIRRVLLRLIILRIVYLLALEADA